MTDGVRSALGGLCIAAAMCIGAAFFYAWDAEVPQAIGALLLLLGGIAAVVCLLRIGYELTRGQEPAKRIR